MDILGIIDADNVPIAVMHYLAPVGILLYFIFVSSLPRETPSVESSRRQPPQSGLLKWIFVLTISTFVCRFLLWDWLRLLTELWSLVGLSLFEDGGVMMILWYGSSLGQITLDLHSFVIICVWCYSGTIGLSSGSSAWETRLAFPGNLYPLSHRQFDTTNPHFYHPSSTQDHLRPYPHIHRII